MMIAGRSLSGRRVPAARKPWKTAGISLPASGRQQFFFALDQFPDFLERLVERATGNEIVYGVDRHAGGWIGIAQILEQAEIRGPVSRDIVLQIHGLNAEIEPLGRRIGGLGGDGVFLTKQARVAVDQE